MMTMNMGLSVRALLLQTTLLLRTSPSATVPNSRRDLRENTQGATARKVDDIVLEMKDVT